MQLSVVVIEDEKSIREFLAAALNSAGMTVHQAETGSQGLTD